MLGVESVAGGVVVDKIVGGRSLGGFGLVDPLVGFSCLPLVLKGDDGFGLDTIFSPMAILWRHLSRSKIVTMLGSLS